MEVAIYDLVNAVNVLTETLVANIKPKRPRFEKTLEHFIQTRTPFSVITDFGREYSSNLFESIHIEDGVLILEEPKEYATYVDIDHIVSIEAVVY